MDKLFDFYNYYICDNDVIIDVNTNLAICNDMPISVLNLSNEFQKKLSSCGIDKLSELIRIHEFLDYSDISKEETIEYNNALTVFFKKIDNEFTKNFDNKLTPIEELYLSVRPYNALKRAGINTVEELEKLSQADLMHVNNMGVTSAKEIMQVLKIYKSNEEKNNSLHDITNRNETNSYIDDNSTPIEKLNLSVRSYNALKKADINTLEQLKTMSKVDLMNIKNMGKTSVKEIIRVLKVFESIKENNDLGVNSANSNLICDTELSNRSKNALEKAGITTIEQLLNIDSFSLSKIQNLGAGSIKEIEIFVSDIKLNPIFSKESERDIVSLFFNNKKLRIHDDKIYIDDNHYVFDAELEKLGISRAIIDFLNRNNIYKLSSVLTEDLLDLSGFGKTKYEILIEKSRKYIELNYVDLTTTDDKLNNIVSNKLLNTIESYHFDGIKKQDLLIQLGADFSQEIIDECINNLINDGKIFVYENNKLFYKYDTFSQFLYRLENGQDKDIMFSRINGLTLEEIADKYEITRERIRQKQQKFIEKYVANDNKVIRYFREDKYKYLYENYFISKMDFMHVFSENEKTYNYLSMRYNHGKTDFKNALSDINVKPRFRVCIQKELDKDYIFFEEERVHRDFQSILKYYCSKKCRVRRDIEEVYYNICEFVNTYADDIKIPISPRAFEAHVVRYNFLISSLNKGIRYYKFDDYDFDSLINQLDIESKNNMIVSSKYYFDKYPELMEEYDILDQYELHNILKRYYSDKNTNIKFTRMPGMEIGTFVLEEYIKDVLIENGEMSTNELISYIMADTGFENGYVQLLLADVSQYREFGKYVYHDNENLSSEQENYLISLMNDLICFKKDILAEYNKKYSNKLDHLPNHIINKAGYTPNQDYIVKKPLNAGSVIGKLLNDKPIVDLKDYNEILKIGRCYNSFRDLLFNRDFICFGEDKYINILKLNDFGISKNDLEEYAKECAKSSMNEYFSFHSLKKNGFDSKLHELGFDDIFYENILKYSPNIKHIYFNGTIIFKAGNNGFTRENFLENIMSKYKKISSSDLINLLKNDYNIEVDFYKINQLIDGTSIYYNNIMDEYYENYQLFIEEI